MSYVNVDSKAKQVVREELCLAANDIISKLHVVTVFSLPSNNLRFEKTLMEMYPDKKFKFVFCEKDEEVTKELQIKLSGTKSHQIISSEVFEGSVSEYLKKEYEEYSPNGYKPLPKFDLVFLDYCGMFTPEVRKDLSKFADLMHEESVLGYTLLGRRDRWHYYDTILPYIKGRRKTLANIRKYAIPSFIKEYCNLGLDRIIRYSDNWKKRSSPMLLYVCRNTDTASKFQSLTFKTSTL